jgi:sigma-B regulation protein RsbU (phosphoserine phosphatase)
MSPDINIKGIEEVYASFFDNLDIAVFSLDAEGSFIYISPAVERITKYTCGDLKRKSFRDITSPEDSRFIEELFLDAAAGVVRRDLWILNADSSKIKCTVAACRAAGKGGVHSIGIMGKIQADDPETEDMIRKFSIAVEHSPATVVITDKFGSIEYVNPKFTSLTGYSSSEAVGQNPRILKSGKQPPEFYKEMWDTISSGREWRGEFHNKKKNGESYWESASISPIVNESGQVTHYIAVKEDITERKMAEEALRISEEKLRKRNYGLERDIEYARVVVNRLLPGKPPILKNLNVDFRYVPMVAIGGDFFSFNSADEQGFGFFIGDVVGHGVSAALFLSLIKSITDRLNAIHGSNPGLYLKELNNELYQSNVLFFITSLYGYFEFSDQSTVFCFAKGGHPPPILYSAAEKTSCQLGSDGIPVGLSPTAQFEEVTRRLLPGDRVYLYTDGIIEARNQSRAMLELEGLETIIARTGDLSLRDSLDFIIEEVRKFRESEPVEDDLVIIGFETL